MSSELFENKEEEFRTIIDGLKIKIQKNLFSSKGEQRKRLVREINRELEDASYLIHEMEDELKKAPPSYRLRMATQVRNSKRELEDTQRELSKSTNENQPGGRTNFSFSPEDDFERMESTQRSRLMQGADTLNRTSESIARSHAISAETDQIGVDIIDDLGTQRDSLVRTRDRLEETNEHLSTSRKILNSMATRLMTNKLILIVIIIMEVCILAGVVYWKFFS